MGQGTASQQYEYSRHRWLQRGISMLPATMEHRRVAGAERAQTDEKVARWRKMGAKARSRLVSHGRLPACEWTLGRRDRPGWQLAWGPTKMSILHENNSGAITFRTSETLSQLGMRTKHFAIRTSWLRWSRRHSGCARVVHTQTGSKRLQLQSANVLKTKRKYAGKAATLLRD